MQKTNLRSQTLLVVVGTQRKANRSREKPKIEVLVGHYTFMARAKTLGVFLQYIFVVVATVPLTIHHHRDRRVSDRLKYNLGVVRHAPDQAHPS